MLKDKTALFITGLTLFIFFVAGLFNFLENPLVITVLILLFMLTIINLFLVNKDKM